MKHFRWLTAFVVGAFLVAGVVSAVVETTSGTTAWLGQGADSLECGKIGEGLRTEAGWMHWIVTGNNEGWVESYLTLSATSEQFPPFSNDAGTPRKDTDNGAIHFVTPYFDLEGLGATHHWVYLVGGSPGNLILSDYCPGDEKSIEVTKTADATWTREHFWDIDKKVETEKGDTVDVDIAKIWLDGPSDYEETATWYVDVTYDGSEDRDFVVSGTITIKNISASGASKEVFSITDDLGYPGYSDIEVVCPVTLPYMLLFGEELICTYEVDLTGEAEPGEFGTNRVDVVVTGDSNEYFATDDWAFGLLPDEEINECVTITDTNPAFDDKYAPPVTVCVGFGVNEEGDSKEFFYSETFAWEDYDDLCGSGFEVPNTASIVETEQTAEAILKVNVQCEELTVSKTAFGEYEVFHAWEIEKFVETDKDFFVEDVPKIWLYADGSGDETAYWTVKVTYLGAEDQNVVVYGAVTIENEGELDAVITDIEDLLDGNLIDLDCGDDFGLPYTLLVGETLTCDYREELDEQVEADNVVTVTTERDVYGPVTEPIIWLEPIGIASSVTISDDSTFEGFGVVELGTLNAGDFEAGEYELFEYEWDFAWAGYPECGSFKYDNTATILDTDPLQDADASLKVNVQCVEDESAWAKGDPTLSFCDISTVGNWGWTNLVVVGESYEWPLYAGAAHCDPDNGVHVATVYVDWSSGYVDVTVVLFPGVTLLGDPHVYAGENRLPTVGRGRETTAPGQYAIDGPFADGTEIYVIVHAVVLVPDPDFGP